MIKSVLFCSAALTLVAGAVWSGPVYDPFLERFQVGTYHDPAAIALEGGFPDDLLEPVVLDTVWIRAARLVLDHAGSVADPFVTPLLLDAGLGNQGTSTWLGHMETAITDLASGTPSDDLSLDQGPLRSARISQAVSHHLETGRLTQAAALAIGLRDRGEDLGLSAREVFVWDLRAKLLFGLAGNKPAGAGSFWPSMLDLGPYDKGNAWALWVAHRWDGGAPLLPPVMTSEKWGRHLSGLSRSWLTTADLYDSDFPAEFQAGLGAVMFRGRDREAHFLKYPDPPVDHALQGLWVRGRRLQSGGDPEVYENLAGGSLLDAGWRMDVWRRASELRLLKGQWPAGLEDLHEALLLAAEGQGHWTTRRRLRQWNEQALVLALARDDLATARMLRDMGLEHFKGKDLEAFGRETGHWSHLLDPGRDPDPDPAGGLAEQARSVVETGRSADLRPVDDSRHELFSRATEHKLWDLWIRWGITLADPEPVKGLVRERALAYRQALESMRSLSDANQVVAAALGIIGRRLGDKPVFERILVQAFGRDVGLACDWAVLTEPSAVPDLLPLLRTSELDRHALLGFALAVGDMRGILAVATDLEGRGLTPDEKRRFLYPLPAPGPVFRAISRAGSDPALLLAVARNESLFEPSIRSRAGALGWMQIMPFHLEARGAMAGPENWRNPGVSISKGDELLLENSKRYAANPYQAVAAYNAGARAASRWERQLGGSPARDIYLAWIGYPETRHYVEKVLIDREIYDWIIRAESSE